METLIYLLYVIQIEQSSQVTHQKTTDRSARAVGGTDSFQDRRWANWMGRDQSSSRLRFQQEYCYQYPDAPYMEYLPT